MIIAAVALGRRASLAWLEVLHAVIGRQGGSAIGVLVMLTWISGRSCGIVYGWAKL